MRTTVPCCPTSWCAHTSTTRACTPPHVFPVCFPSLQVGHQMAEKRKPALLDSFFQVGLVWPGWPSPALPK